MADNNPFGDARAAQQFGREFGKFLYDASVAYFSGGSFNGGSFQGTSNNMASQSAASDRARSNGWQMDNDRPKQQNPFSRRKSPLDQFEDAFTKEMLNAITGGDFQKNINKALTNFSKNMGFDISELGQKLGQQMAKDALKSPLGQQITGKVRDVLVGENGILSKKLGNVLEKLGNTELKNVFNQFVGDLFNTGGVTEAVGGVTEAAGSLANAAGVAESGMATVGAGAAAEGTALAGAATAISTALPPILVAMAAITVAAELLGPALEGVSDVFKALGAAAFRNDTERAKRREAAEERLKQDIDYMVKKPFEILTEAAQEWYNTWDQNLRTIGQTQGYDKEAVYNLYSSYAERLREEGLDSVISSTSVIDGLKQVLGTGLSGEVAEEFAYTATMLQAAIPTQDFFQYAGTYAQIASNAISQGASQAQAIALANAELEAFANNLLYSSRELAGGFTTGLTNASQLFTDAVNIAQAAKTGNASAISGTLTSVSAILGAVAPDLAQGLVQNIVQAAIGGNSESIVALRSLAGINAGNTQFLKAFAEDPQSIFTKIFNKLSELQNMSEDNFMEVAEGLAPIFGVDMAALARVDFSYLADAVDAMDITSGSLEDNLELLASGQTTTTAEQAKMTEINKMIIDEGLGIVMDNEAARMIQEHMWQEQQTVALQNSTYSVELQGAVLHMIEGIQQTVLNVLRFLNPIGAIAEAVSGLAETAADTAEQQNALRTILTEGAVKVNDTALANLTNYTGSSVLDVFNEGGNYANNYNNRLAQMLFGAGVTDNLTSNILRGYSQFTSIISPSARENLIWNSGLSGLHSLATSLGTTASGRTNSSLIQSQYGWNTVGKTNSKLFALNQSSSSRYEDIVADSEVTAEARRTQELKDKLKQLMATASEVNQATLEFTEDEAGVLSSAVNWGTESGGPMSYESWVQSIFGNNTEEFQEALTAYGTTEEALRGMFQSNQAAAQASITNAREDAATSFYEDARRVIPEMRKFWGYSDGNGIYAEVVWNPFVTSLKEFWGMDNGSYKDQFWDPFFADDEKFDQGILKIFDEMVNQRDNWIGDTSVTGTVRGLLYTINESLLTINTNLKDWMQDWTDFYINHTTYSARTSSADWSEMVNLEQSARDDISLALANSLEAISNIDDLKDPTVQSNVLLAKIVVLLEAIMQQNNSTGGLSLIDTISAMSLGLTRPT